MYLHYKNISDENPIECTFEFPLEESTIVSKLIAEIDDRIIEAKVKEKEEAKDHYNDAIASGNAAIFAEINDKSNKVITLLLGNLQAGQVAKVNI